MGASERNETARHAWREQIKHLDARRIKVIDETGMNIAMTPLFARAPKGERAVDSVPHNTGTRTTVLASLSLSGMGEAMIIEGARNTETFVCYLEQVLGPSLQPGDIVIMDNLSSHLGQNVQQAIEARGCQLLFLPTYSPDLSPIEKAFSKLKAFLRRVGARTREQLLEAIAQALQRITAQDALGWFLHCGYAPADSPSSG